MHPSPPGRCRRRSPRPRFLPFRRYRGRSVGSRRSKNGLRFFSRRKYPGGSATAPPLLRPPRARRRRLDGGEAFVRRRKNGWPAEGGRPPASHSMKREAREPDAAREEDGSRPASRSPLLPSDVEGSFRKTPPPSRRSRAAVLGSRPL